MTAIAHAKLGDIAQYLRGINFKPDDVTSVGAPGTVACMRTKNIQDSLDCSDVWGVAETFVRRTEQILQEGDMLVSSANSWNLVGKCCWIPHLPWKTTFGGFVSALRANPMRVNQRYLYWWFSSDRTQALLRSFGRKTTSISNLSAEQCLNLSVPLPPLPEQRRIAAILDQADALRTKRREALAQLDSLTQSIFIEMFGDPVTNPFHWPSMTLGSVASKFSDGPFGSNLKSEHYVDAGVRVIRLQNIGVNEFVDKDKAYVSERHFESIKKHECRPGDVLVGTMGDPNLRACLLPETVGLAINKADCVQIRVADRVANSTFLCGLLNHPSTLQLAQDLMHGQTRVRISMGGLRGLAVPVPPLPLQQTFATRIQSVEALKATHRAALAELETLFTSLQHRAFRGEL